MSEIAELWRAFQQATGDDKRQSLLLKMGCSTLSFSVVGFVLFLSLAVIAWLPLWAMQWDQKQVPAYLLVITVTAACWWMIRRVHHAR